MEFREGSAPTRMRRHTDLIRKGVNYLQVALFDPFDRAKLRL
jgi:hypothetical protein